MSAQGMAMMPWFHRDFLAATQGWTLPQTGAYFLLLGAQWEMGPLPNNLAELAAIARTSVREFKPLWRKFGRKFAQAPEGLVNWRLEEHRQRSVQLRERRREGAALTNAKRLRNVIPLAERVAERPAERTLSVSPPSPSPSPRRLTKGESEGIENGLGNGSSKGPLTDGARGKS